MQDEHTPDDRENPEQAIQGAPGSPVKIQQGVYKIYTHLSGSKLVSMSLSGNDPDSRNVRLYQDTSAAESTWSISRLSNDAYLMRNGKMPQLAIRQVSGNNIYAEYEASPISFSAFYWFFKNAGNGYMYIENRSYGHVMDVKGSNTADNTDIIGWPYTGTANQKFRLVKIGDL
ncbi:RICIN domain-containing protein [Pseudomonas gingeri]|uniref:RICIN domain-containing protein n=1 Tax=Pseudomonas gingeri TaxID=117681 RepID=UPI0015BE192B|nr:RICIN domain-containing protein [Pseudomonas gingeri]NWE73489.1 RICIN domain-containing protein [Pseudomonas gingeri]